MTVKSSSCPNSPTETEREKFLLCAGVPVRACVCVAQCVCQQECVGGRGGGRRERHEIIEQVVAESYSESHRQLERNSALVMLQQQQQNSGLRPTMNVAGTVRYNSRI